MPLRSHRPVTARIATGLAALPVAAALSVALTAAPALAATAAPQQGARSQQAGHQQNQVRAQEWWLGQLGVRQAWRMASGSGITVAVLSDGVDTAQSDLAGSVISGPDYLQPGAAAGGHYFGRSGTMAASLIAGHGHGTRGAKGIMGIAPAARILSVRVTLSPPDPLLRRAGVAVAVRPRSRPASATRSPRAPA